ncbi:MAG: HindIII family type II restriction endonuclease [Ignavibacteria bacterium]
MRKKLIDFIFKIAKEKKAFDKLEKYISKIKRNELSNNIIECGILPEMFDHDSSEEKLWAKLSDIILSQTLNHLGIKSEVLGARGNSADVYGKTNKYTIVGDAKTFRLSRTAKNQKDFKVSALDSWRQDNNYAVLVAPLAQYPNRASQIYNQAIDKNVTLLSYTHLYFLLDYHESHDLQPIWETGNALKVITKSNLLSSSTNYWEAIDKTICNTVRKNAIDLKKYKQLEIDKTKEIGKEGITYWRNKIFEYSKLSKEEAIKRLIKSEKIEAKIETIKKAINIKS